MARTQHIVGLDVGSSNVRVVACERSDTNSFIISGVGEAPTDGVRRGAVESTELVAKSIGRALHDMRKNFGVTINHALVSLSEPRTTSYISKGTVSISRADGEVTREDAARALEMAEGALPRLGNREIIQTFPLFYTLDRETHIREPAGLLGAQLGVEALFVAGFSQNIKNVIKAVESVNLMIDDLVPATYAASFHAMNKKQKEVGAMLLDIGGEVSSLAVFEEGLLVSLEMIPVGSAHITHDIGLGFQIDLVSAERVKRNAAALLEPGKKEIRLSDMPKNFEDTFSQRKLREIVSARLGDIFELIEKHLKRIGRSGLLPGGVILSGGGAKLFDIQNMAREDLRLPTEIASYASGVGAGKELVTGPEWAVALGLCKYAFEQQGQHGRMSEIFSSPISRRISKFLKSLIP